MKQKTIKEIKEKINELIQNGELGYRRESRIFFRKSLLDFAYWVKGRSIRKVGMKKNCGECDALNSIGLMVDGKMFFGDIETLQKLVNKTIANAKLDAIEKWIDEATIGNKMTFNKDQIDYLAELRKAAGRGE